MSRRIKKYVAERDAILRSLDLAAAKKHCRKWGIEIPKNDEVLLAGLHKARLDVTSFTEEEKAASRKWLAEHGFKPLPFWASDDGKSIRH